MTSLAESLSGSKAGDPIPDQVYRCLQDLAATPLMLRRVLVVGSLSLDGLARLHCPPGCQCDYLVVSKIQYMATAKRVTIASPTLIAFCLG